MTETTTQSYRDPLSTDSTDKVVSDDIAEALKRDFMLVSSKCAYVISLPAYTDKMARFKTWDFWGPMVFSLVVSLSLFFGAYATDQKAAFSTIFFTYWIGAFLVGLSSQLLGSTLGVLAMTSAILYTTFPLGLGSIICCLCPHYGAATILLKFIIIGLTAIWGGLISTRFIETASPAESRLLIRIPISIFYFALASMVVIA